MGRTVLSAAILFICSAHTGVAQDKDVERGRQIAADRCGACHAIGVADKSAHEGAPPFRSFKTRWPIESLAESLAEGIVTGHEDMPVFVFTPDEVGDFLGYLETL